MITNPYSSRGHIGVLRTFTALCLAALFSLSGCKESFSPHIAPEADAERWVSETLDNPDVQANVALPAGAGGKTAISVNNFPPGDQPLEQDIVAQEIEMFERKYPDVRVDYSTWTFSPESFFERAKNGTLTDIVEVSASQMTPIMDLHYAADITELTQRTAEMAIINPEVLQFLIREGRLYGVPTQLHTMALFYNKRLFDDTINPPPPPPEEKKKDEPASDEKKSDQKKSDQKKKKPQQDDEEKKGQGAESSPRDFLEDADADGKADYQLAQYGGYPSGYNYGQQQEEAPPGYSNRGQREIQDYYQVQPRRGRASQYPQQPMYDAYGRPYPPGYYPPQQPQQRRQPQYQQPQQYEPRRPRYTPAPRTPEEQQARDLLEEQKKQRAAIDGDVVTTAAEQQTTVALEIEEPATTSVSTANLPQDWDSFIRTAVKLTNHKTGQYGYAPLLFGQAGGREFCQWAIQTGLNIETPVGKTVQLDVNTSAAGEVAQFIKELHWKYDITPSLERCYADNAMQMFADGKVAMVMLPATRETIDRLFKMGMPLEELGIAALPGGPDNRRHLAFGKCLIINSQIEKEKRAAAFKWLLFQLDPERIKLREQYYHRMQEITGVPRVPIYTERVQRELNDAIRIYRTLPIYPDYENHIAANVRPEPPYFTLRLYEAVAEGVRPIIERQESKPAEDIGFVAMDFEARYLNNAPTQEGFQRYLQMLTANSPFKK